jgi:hypothetical protein
MAETFSSLAAEPEHRLDRALVRRVVGRPWVKGQTGCPGGNPRNGKQYRALYAELEADLGGNLSAIERVQLDQAVGLVILSRRERSSTRRVRLANQVQVLLRALNARRKTMAVTKPLREQIAEELAQ